MRHSKDHALPVESHGKDGSSRSRLRRKREGEAREGRKQGKGEEGSGRHRFGEGEHSRRRTVAIHFPDSKVTLKPYRSMIVRTSGTHLRRLCSIQFHGRYQKSNNRTRWKRSSHVRRSCQRVQIDCKSKQATRIPTYHRR